MMGGKRIYPKCDNPYCSTCRSGETVQERLSVYLRSRGLKFKGSSEAVSSSETDDKGE